MEALAQEYVVVDKAPDGFITDDPAMLRLPSGRLLATYTFRIVTDPKQDNPNRFQLSISEDDGKSWQHLKPLELTVALPFLHSGRLYLLGNRLGRRDIVILCSEDEGESWSEPVTLFTGNYWNAPTGVAVSNDIFYRAFDVGPDDGKWQYRGSCVVAGNLKQDLMNPESWRISPAVFYPGTPKELACNRYPGHWVDHWLEPNVVNVGGRIRVLTRPRIDGYATSGMCAICDLTDDGEKMDLSFTQFHPFPGGQNKFYIIYDEASGLYWTPVNLPTDTQDIQNREGRLKEKQYAGRPGNERRFLFLQYSLDSINWFSAGCIAFWPSPLQSFHYAAPLADRQDMLILSRTSKEARNQHDSELVTFHRIERFRSLAFDLHSTI